MNTALDFNLLGPTAALATFLSIWVGHAAVRKIEYAAPILWLPEVGLSILGLALIGLSLWTAERLISTGLGILGITLFWDAFELARQAARVRNGRAPANPANPRHASPSPVTRVHPSSRQGQ